MQTSKLKYRTTPIVLSTIFFSACALWLYFGPRTGGRIGQILRNGDDLSFIGWAAVTISAILAALLLPHALRGVLGRPAIENDGETLSIKMFPSKDIPLSEIESVLVRKDDVKVVTKQGYKRKINARLVTDHESFFAEIRPEAK